MLFLWEREFKTLFAVQVLWALEGFQCGLTVGSNCLNSLICCLGFFFLLTPVLELSLWRADRVMFMSYWRHWTCLFTHPAAQLNTVWTLQIPYLCFILGQKSLWERSTQQQLGLTGQNEITKSCGCVRRRLGKLLDCLENREVLSHYLVNWPAELSALSLLCCFFLLQEILVSVFQSPPLLLVPSHRRDLLAQMGLGYNLQHLFPC